MSAALAGTIAQLTSPGTAMTVMAAGSVCVTAGLVAAGRREGRGTAVPGSDGELRQGWFGDDPAAAGGGDRGSSN
ncbi:hypothetical protein [Streptomyces sp. B21-083]|uniref:hypothetical protein n=1 Tax=Streptomyces sp. B21-083 TaxID=3039410 RepID=UPI003FA7E3D9